MVSPSNLIQVVARGGFFPTIIDYLENAHPDLAQYFTKETNAL